MMSDTGYVIEPDNNQRVDPNAENFDSEGFNFRTHSRIQQSKNESKEKKDNGGTLLVIAASIILLIAMAYWMISESPIEPNEASTAPEQAVDLLPMQIAEWQDNKVGTNACQRCVWYGLYQGKPTEILSVKHTEDGDHLEIILIDAKFLSDESQERIRAQLNEDL